MVDLRVPIVNRILDPTGLIDDGLGAVKDVVLGGLTWSAETAGRFITTTLQGIADALIPDSWATHGADLIQWIVAAPNFAATISGPTGERFAFAGFNDLRATMLWLGLALLPLTLLYAQTRATFGLDDHPMLPLARTLMIAIGLLGYVWLWRQACALTNQITAAVLGVPRVEHGLNRLLELMAGGAAAKGVPLIGVLALLAAAAMLVAMVFAKVILLVAGALVYVTGPLMFGIAPTERGEAAARAWATVAVGLFVLPLLWATVFAVGALFVGDSANADVIVGGDRTVGKMVGGLVLLMAGAGAFWLNLKLCKIGGGLLGGQVSGLLSSATRGGGGSARPAMPNLPARESLNRFGSKVRSALSSAAGSTGASGRLGAVAVGATRGAGVLARGGLMSASTAAGAATWCKGAGPSGLQRGAAALGAAKAGAVATRMERAGRNAAAVAMTTTTTARAANVESSSSSSLRAPVVVRARAGDVTPPPRADARSSTPRPGASSASPRARAGQNPGRPEAPRSSSTGQTPPSPSSTPRSPSSPRGPRNRSLRFPRRKGS
jgi:hypothetical protein